MKQDSLSGEPKVLGDYEVLSLVARGGAGTVYKARSRITGQVVAVKTMLPSLIGNRVLLQRFEQEFRAASVLSHPNIVRALDFCWHEGRPFLVMEFLEGESLGQMIQSGGRLPEDEAIRYITQICEGLEEAHRQGVIHRDVKPDNIVVTPDGQAKLTDLGLAKELMTDLDLTRTGRGLGTPHFMAPEQFRDAKSADPRSDVYSLAATLYQLVTGHLPFGVCSPMDVWMRKTKDELEAPRSLVPTLSGRIDRAILRAMSVNPALRPSSCRELAEELAGPAESDFAAAAPQLAPLDQWYVIHKNASGQLEKLAIDGLELRRRLGGGDLGAAHAVHVSRSPDGPFEPLAHYADFSDLVNADELARRPGAVALVSPSQELLLSSAEEAPEPPEEAARLPRRRRGFLLVLTAAVWIAALIGVLLLMHRN